MTKKQTPIQQAIIFLTSIKDNLINQNYYDRADAYTWTIYYLKSLLEKEKEFAKDFFSAGGLWEVEESEQVDEGEALDFNEFYEQYEEEKKG